MRTISATIQITGAPKPLNRPCTITKSPSATIVPGSHFKLGENRAAFYEETDALANAAHGDKTAPTGQNVTNPLQQRDIHNELWCLNQIATQTAYCHNPIFKEK
jgi:hypothetical protein